MQFQSFNRLEKRLTKGSTIHLFTLHMLHYIYRFTVHFLDYNAYNLQTTS